MSSFCPVWADAAPERIEKKRSDAVMRIEPPGFRNDSIPNPRHSAHPASPIFGVRLTRTEPPVPMAGGDMRELDRLIYSERVTLDSYRKCPAHGIRRRDANAPA